MHREPTMECGGVIKGEAPPNRGECPNTEKHPPTTCNVPKPCRSTEAWGPLGVFTPPWGVQTYGGCTNVQGVYKHGGVQQPPPSIKTCLPLKSRKKPYLKLISYT